MRTKAALVMVGAAVAFFCVAWGSGVALAVNPSVSMPRGLYLFAPIKNPTVGDLVAACIPAGDQARMYRARDYLPASDRCASGLPPVMKPIVATAGDMVAIDADGTRVNGVLLPNSRVFDTDSQGLPIAHLALPWRKRLVPGEFFLLANHATRSLDSRYYGPLPRANIIGFVHPLAVEK